MTADESQWIDRACALLSADPSRSVSYPGLAVNLGVSYEVFRRRFRRLTGKAPHRYRQSRVIEQAAELLCTTRRTVSAIAVELGFCDEFHFSRLFKKVRGQSPTVFRQDHLGRGRMSAKQHTFPASVMNPAFVNPFSNDPDRHELWDIIVRRAIEAFLLKDWDAMKDTFIEKGFFGIDGQLRTNIDSWRLTFSSLAAYRGEWLKQAAYYTRRFKRGLRHALYKAMELHSIDFKGGIALVHMKFEWGLAKTSGHRLDLPFQTLWICRKVNGIWKIAGFVGYLPTVSRKKAAKTENSSKSLPSGIWQHVNTLSDISSLRSRLAQLERSQEG